MANHDLITGDFLDQAEEIVATDDGDFRRRSSSMDDGSSALMDSSDDDDDDDEDIEVDVDGDVDGDDNVVSELIDIREPLRSLRKSLERRMGHSLQTYSFWLQDTQMLSDECTLVEQCIQGEGLVQIKMEISGGKINIVDVLKPEDDVVAEAEAKRRRHYSSTDEGSPPKPTKIKKEKVASVPPKSTLQPDKPAESVTRWVVSTLFRKEQENLNFPTDPLQWDRLHVAHWINWVATEFPESTVDRHDWDVDGRELCAFSHEDFKKKVPIDPGDMLWTHLELLRKCKFVAVVQKGTKAPTGSSSSGFLGRDSNNKGHLERKTAKKPPVRLGSAKFSVMSESSPGNRTGNNGQVQLWQFLLELLTDKEHRETIHWVGDDGEFKLEKPEDVARLWGTRKNKPNMNYEKLSRALRYYYDGDMICKVHGKRFVYKFVCNLKQLIGYNASELSRLVLEAEQKAVGSISVYKG